MTIFVEESCLGDSEIQFDEEFSKEFLPRLVTLKGYH